MAGQFLLLLVLFFLSKQCCGARSRSFDPEAWTDWTSWSTCSRTCDGGVTQQFRKCKSAEGCHGSASRSRMCNMQPCADFRDYRNEQCRSFNGLDYRGLKRTWEASEDPNNPCSLCCRAENTDWIVKLAPKVKDGTRCRSGGLHVCVAKNATFSKCESVGCDLKIGSPKKVDICGICGGDGSACSSPIYRWEIVALEGAECDAPCGGGQVKVKAVCTSAVSSQQLEDSFCNKPKPLRFSQNCNFHPCQPKWETSEWSDCSQTCGSSGMRVRKVYCYHEKNKTKIQVADKLCMYDNLKKPTRQEPCNQNIACSHWHVGPYSPCSASCGGKGWKTRNVVCRDSHNLPSWSCDKRLQPSEKVECSDENGECPTVESGVVVEDVLETPSSAPPFSDGAETEAEGFGREYSLPLMEIFSPLDNRFVDQQNAMMVDENSLPSEPTETHSQKIFICSWLFYSFVAEEWSSCSQTCGQGIRTRDVKCKIFLEFSRTIATLPDKECLVSGPKPSETEICFASNPCEDKETEGAGEVDGENLSDSHHAALADADTGNYRKTISVGLPPGISMSDMSFSWKVLGYSPCSASCLGGIQEAMLQCVREFDQVQRVSSPVLCMDKPQPDIATTRTCNDHSCPPRWNVSDFGPCSKNCGGGVAMREVNCIHEVTRGNVVVIPSSICPQPMPRMEKLCNTVNCPPFWEAGEWSRCSKPCGGGERKRKVICKQVVALGQVVEYSLQSAGGGGGGVGGEEGDHHCLSIGHRPMDVRPCNKKPCSSRKGGDDSSAPFFVQHEFRKKLSLTLNGNHATLYNGVTIKLKCPAKNVDRLVWMKGHQFVSIQANKVQVLNNRILKISNSTFSDSGVYTCLLQSGHVISNVTLMIRPYDGQERRTQRPLSTLADQQQPGVSMWEENMITPNSKIFSGSSASSCCCRLDPILLLLSLFLFLLATVRFVRGGGELESLNKKAVSEECSRKIKKCARAPSWKLGTWSDCLAQFCFNWNSALRRRSVFCSSPNGTRALDGHCKEQRPQEEEECYHAECLPQWLPGEWSQCSSRCGSVSRMTRTISCVWHGSGLPAGSGCSRLARPVIEKPCRSSRSSCLRSLSGRGRSGRSR